ncbi:IMV virion membrane protein [Equine molluscum contagiosum-like virus]|nr:IMV virion membrane protein [Equine molluscum contagiosum-like virus]
MSYLSYHNIFDEFAAGAGVKDEELFTPEEKALFLPQGVPAPGGAFFSNIMRYSDMRTLLGLILFVIALGAPPAIGIFMVGAAALLMPLPCLVIAYCMAMQISHPQAGANVGMAVLCTLAAIAVMIIARSNMVVRAVTVAAYVVLAVLFCVYALRLSRGAQSTPCARGGGGFIPTFSEGY